MPLNIIASQFIHYHVPGRRKRLLAILTIAGPFDQDEIFVAAKRKLTATRTRIMTLDKFSVKQSGPNTIVRASFLGQRSNAGLDPELIGTNDFTFTITVDGEDDNDIPVNNQPPVDFDPCDFG